MLVYNDFETSVVRAFSEINPKWRDLPGLVICGTHNPREVDFLINEIHEARIGGLPFYAECFGYQLAAIEWARNVEGIKDATSEEFGTGTFVVVKRPKLKVGLREGETWWSNYMVIPELVEDFDYPKNFFVSPAHPSYQSRKGAPHPFIKDFLDYAKRY